MMMSPLYEEIEEVNAIMTQTFGKCGKYQLNDESLKRKGRPA